MKETGIFPREFLRHKSYDNIINCQNNIYDNCDNFFFLMENEHNKKNLYTFKNIFKLIERRSEIQKHQKNIIINKNFNTDYYNLPNIPKTRKHNKQMNNKSICLKKNTAKSNDNNQINIQKSNIKKKLYFLNYDKITNKKTVSNGKSIFSNSILDNACNPISIDILKEANEEDIFKDYENCYFQISTNNNLPNINNIYLNPINNNDIQLKNNENELLSFNFGNIKNAEILTNTNNFIYNRRKLKKSEKEFIDNTNNNSLEENDIGVIGLFSKNNKKKFDLKKKKKSSKFMNLNLNSVDIKNFNNFNNLLKKNSCIPVNQKSIEFNKKNCDSIKLDKEFNNFKKENKILKNENKIKVIFNKK